MSIREELELDISDAERQVELLGAQLTQVVQQLRADFADALSGVAEFQAEVEVQVTADTSDAESAVEELADTEIPPVEIPVEDEEVEAANEKLQELGETAEDVGSKATAAAAGVLGASLGIGELFTSAVEAEGSLQAFEAALGDMTDEIRRVNVGSLDQDLNELAIILGSSDEGLQDAAARIFSLGEAAGVARPQVAATTEQIIALSARAVALRPSLGDVGDVAERLSGALARGGRPLAQFGLSLTQAEIAARAAELGFGDTAEELTIFEKQAAAADILTKQLGSSLGEDVARGTENAGIQLRSLREQLGEIVETAGQPTIEPFMEALREALPAIQPVAQALGELAVEAVPALVAGLRGVTPLLQLAADVLGEIPAGAIEAVAAFVALNKVMGALNTNVGKFSPGLAGGALSMGNLNAATVGAIPGLLLYADAQEKAAEAEAKRTDLIDGVAQALTDQTVDVREAIIAQEKLRISEQTLAGEEGEVAKAFREAGIDIGDFINAAADGPDALDRFKRANGELLNSLGASSSDLDDYNHFLQQAAERSLQAAVASGEFTQAQVDAAAAANTSTVQFESMGKTIDVEVVNAIGVMEDLRGVTDEVSDSSVRLSAEAIPAFGQLGDAVTKFSELTGVGLQAYREQLVEARRVAQEELDAIGRDTVENVGVITDAFQDLNEDGIVSLEEFTQALQDQLADQAAFFANIAELNRRGASDLALTLFEQGEVAAGAAADAAALNDAQLAEKEAFVDQNRELNDGLASNAEALRQDLVTSADATRDQVNASFQGLAVAAAVKAATEAGSAEARAGAGRIADSIGIALAAGFIAARVRAVIEARAMAQAAIDAVVSVLQISSPSKVLMDLGEQSGIGFALGIQGSESEVVRAAEAIARGAAAGVVTGAPAAGNSVANSIGPVTLSVEVNGAVSEETARRTGVAVADGFVGEMSRLVGVEARIG